jgi:STE24 endopeptidase
MDSSALAFTYLFCALLVGGLIVRTVLASRQIRHVVRHRDQVPEPFAATIGLDAHRKAADYTVAKARFGMLESAIEAALLLGWTLLGGLHALNQWLLQWMEPGMWQQLVLLGAFTLIGAVLTLPLGWWSTFRLEERFGFNKMSVGLWLGDLLKGAVVGALIGLPIAALVLWLMGAAGPAWWLWAWGAWMVFNLLLLVLYPTLIAPLFNKFEPLQDETLKTRVNDLMKRCGFAAKGLFVMDGSTRSAHANAYFTGFGASKRVVFYDTLLRQLNAGEVEAVLAHELGHFKHRHVLKRMAAMFALSLAGFALLGWLSGHAWFYTGLGVQPNMTAPNDALAILLFMLAVPVFGFFVAPLPALISRRHEFEADAYAVAQTNGADLSRALLKLYQDNASTLTPDPVFVKFYYSHPPASERLARMAAA